MAYKIKRCNKYLKKKIKRNIAEGYPQKQAVAISFSQARKKGCKFEKRKGD